MLSDADYKRQLFAGEGNFTFTEAYLNKHGDQLASSITATELKTESELDRDTLDRIEKLRNLGVTVILGFDATDASQIKSLQLPNDCIRWNMPHDGKPYSGQTLPRLIKQFLKACRSGQNCGDKVYITIKQANQKQSKEKRRTSYSAFSQGYEYNVVEGSTVQGYRLVKKKSFHFMGDKRYPNYRFTTTNLKSEHKNHNAQTFVFEKMPLNCGIDAIRRVQGQMAEKVEETICNRNGVPYKRKFFNITTDQGSTSDPLNLQLSESEEETDDDRPIERLFYKDFEAFFHAEQARCRESQGDIPDILDLNVDRNLENLKKRFDKTKNAEDLVRILIVVLARGTGRRFGSSKDLTRSHFFANLDEFLESQHPRPHPTKFRRVEDGELFESDSELEELKRRYNETKNGDDLLALIDAMVYKSSLKASQ